MAPWSLRPCEPLGGPLDVFGEGAGIGRRGAHTSFAFSPPFLLCIIIINNEILSAGC